VISDIFHRRFAEDPEDPGFGAKVSAASGRRLLNRDGTFNARRIGLRPSRSWSPYHDLLTISWTRFFAVIGACYVALNVVFALAYTLCGPGALAGVRTDSFSSRLVESFFLSAQTLSTVGFGRVSPLSYVANAIAVAELWVGFIMVAIAAGLVFARFSRPMARLVFSRTAVIAPRQDGTALMFRFANARKNQLIELRVRVLFSRLEPGPGGRVRRYYTLSLERERVAFIPLHLTVVHPITERSPLYGLTREDLARDSAEIMVLVTAMDETFSQSVHARTSYTHEEIDVGARFASVLSLADDGIVEMDMRRFHLVEPRE
jgi:inward rectifier potassium channel